MRCDNDKVESSVNCFQVISDKTFLRQGHTVGHFKLDIGTVFNNPGKLVFGFLGIGKFN